MVHSHRSFSVAAAISAPESSTTGTGSSQPSKSALIVHVRSLFLTLAVLLPSVDGAMAQSNKIGAWSTTVSAAVPDTPARAKASPRRPSAEADDHALEGIASYYWQGQKTASGEPFDKRAMTAAHPTLPFNSLVRVKDQRTGNSVVVRINDRGPFKPGRVIDLSERAAEVIGMTSRGLTPVELEVLGVQSH